MNWNAFSVCGRTNSPNNKITDFGDRQNVITLCDYIYYKHYVFEIFEKSLKIVKKNDGAYIVGNKMANSGV